MKTLRRTSAERTIKVAFLVVFALSLADQLFVPPTIGLANNGDFQKMASWFNRVPVFSAPTFMTGDYGYFSPKYIPEVHSILSSPLEARDLERFLHSPAYSLQYPWRSDEDFVQLLYSTIWCFAPSPADRQYWLDVLHRPGSSRSDLLHDFLNHPNFQKGALIFRSQRLLSSTPLFIAPAFWISSSFSRNGVADLRLLGFVYSSILISVLSWTVLSLRGLSRISWIILLAVTWLVFADTAWISQLNSLLTDTSATVSLFVALLSLTRMAVKGETRTGWIVTLAGVFLFTTSKLQHLLPGLCIAGALSLYAWKTSSPYRRWIAMSSAMVFAGCLILILYTSPQYSIPNKHQAIFRNVVPYAPDPAGALRQLGLPTGYVRYTGTTAYQEGTPLSSPEFVAKIAAVPRLSLGWFYLTHPSVVIKVILRDLGDKSLHRLYYLGNFEQSAGHSPQSQSHSFSAWRDWKIAHLADHPIRCAALYLGSILAMWLALWRARSQAPDMLWLAAFVITMCAGLEFATAALADGLDNGRHLSIFVRLSELCLVSALYGTLFHVESLSAAQPSAVRLNVSSARG